MRQGCFATISLWLWRHRELLTAAFATFDVIMLLSILSLLQGCLPDVPDLSGCLRACANTTSLCTERARYCAEACGEDRDCALDCVDLYNDCLEEGLECAAECIEDVQRSLE